MSNFEFIDEEYETVVLELDDGTEQEFAIVDEVMMEEQRYVLLAMIDGDTISDDPDDMIFMRDDTDAEECEEGEIILSMIETDEEYGKVVDCYTADVEE